LSGLPEYDEFKLGPDWIGGRRALRDYAFEKVKFPKSMELPTAGAAPSKTDADKFVKSLTPQEYFSLELSLTLEEDPSYQRLQAEYNILVTTPPQTITNNYYPAAPSGPGFESRGPSSGGGSSSSSSGGGASAGAAGGGGKAPLPIHVHYDTFLQQGWYCQGRKCDVPKDACFVGHNCDTYVWVMPCQLDALNKFTLAILDFYNIGNSGGSNLPSPPVSTLK
jgi:hypothetical protein